MDHLNIDDINWNELHGMTPTTVQDAHVIADIYDACLHVVSDIVTRENILLDQGAIEEALALFADKQKYSADYARASDLMRRNLIALTRLIPSRLPDLKDRQEEFMQLLQSNAKAINMMRSLSETMLRGIAKEAGTQTHVTTYGKNGKTNQQSLRTPSAALIVSTTM